MNNEFFERVRLHLNTRDRFAKANAIRMEEIREGYASSVMNVTDSLLNGADVVQGGAIFTLADLAFAGASNSFGPRSTAMGANISFLRPGTGKFLRAEANVVSRGRKTCLVDVEVKNDAGKLIAKLLVTGFLFEKESIVPLSESSDGKESA